MHQLIESIGSHWRYRDLLWNLVYKELKVRFHGTAFGFLWSFAAPSVMILLYAFVFGHVFHSGVDHFVLYLMIGLVHFNLLNHIIVQSCDSLTNASNLLQKIYFPRVLVPLATAIYNFVIWFMWIIILLAVLPLLGGHYGPLLPLYFVALLAYCVMCLGLGLAVSVLAVEYRDLRHVVDIGLTVLFWATPIVYSPAALGDVERVVLALNPLSYFLAIFRDLLYRDTLPGVIDVAVALAWTGLCLAVGVALYWRRAKWLVEVL